MAPSHDFSACLWLRIIRTVLLQSFSAKFDDRALNLPRRSGSDVCPKKRASGRGVLAHKQSAPLPGFRGLGSARARNNAPEPVLTFRCYGRNIPSRAAQAEELRAARQHRDAKGPRIRSLEQNLKSIHSHFTGSLSWLRHARKLNPFKGKLSVSSIEARGREGLRELPARRVIIRRPSRCS
eukprot:scaffold7403_cov277-Pinguiococcus_pyrenoidosus.AAC.9